MMRKTLKVLLSAILIFTTYFLYRIQVSPPEIDLREFDVIEREELSRDFFAIKNNWLRKNNRGLWEMKVNGSPIELGVYAGKLSKELIYNQEVSFVDQINELIPSKSYLQFLKYFIGWFNRDIESHIIKPYKEEIYGISLSTSGEFNYVANNYQRMLNYHGAHDIGHALKDLALVGCTSFVANQNRQDSTMLVGRNFDFYINDDFSKDKIIAFIEPNMGYNFAYITWASFIGVASGMNTEGITVTINAAKSDLPTQAKTPISLLAREILQFAANLDQALEIAKKRETFVSESILVSSAKNDKAIIIEKSPTEMGIYSSDDNFMVCSNHFQSETFKNDPNNLENIERSASLYRQNRCEQLLDRLENNITVEDACSVLRNTNGFNDLDIGLGNEKAMNQLISHHSVVFQPKQLRVWVSTYPYQLGDYLCYDLNEIFKLDSIPSVNDTLYISNLTIQSDSLMLNSRYKSFLMYKEYKNQIEQAIKNNIELENAAQIIEKFTKSNSEYYYSYEVAGDYFKHFGDFLSALKYYKRAQVKEIPNVWDFENIERKIEVLKEQLQ